MRSSPGDASERRVKHRPRPGLGWFNWMILTAVLVVSAWWFHFREPPARPGAGASPAAAVSTAGRGAGATTARPAMTVTTAGLTLAKTSCAVSSPPCASTQVMRTDGSPAMRGMLVCLS